jgi:hypothetical protein
LGLGFAISRVDSRRYYPANEESVCEKVNIALADGSRADPDVHGRAVHMVAIPQNILIVSGGAIPRRLLKQ